MVRICNQMREIEEALMQLATTRYLQIIEANLTKREFHVIWNNDSTSDGLLGLWSRTELFYSHKEMRALRKLRNVELLNRKLNENGSVVHKFRVKVKSRVRWMQVEIVKSTWYSENNVDVYIFVKDIEDNYGKEYKARKQAEKLAKTDSLTGFANRFAFERFCETSFSYKSVGIIYADLNSLKTVNDTKGHIAGDEYIKNFCREIDCIFGNYNRYRIGGDEFVVICTNINMIEFADKVKQFTSKMSDDGSHMPFCSFGYKWADNNTVSIQELVKGAEKEMYKHKEEDYSKYHVERRRSV